MRTLLTLCVIALLAVCAETLPAQKGVPAGGNPGRGGNKYKQSGEKQAAEAQKRAQQAAKKAEQEEKDAERDAAKAERDAAQKEREARRKEGDNTTGESESEAPPQPGEVVKRADKDTRIDKWMDELKLAEASRAKFKTIARAAWDECEKEDKRYYTALKKTDDPTALNKLADEHKSVLKKIWEEADKQVVEGKLASDDQLTNWQKLSEELRSATNTDRWLAAQAKPETKKEKKAEGQD